MNAKDANGSTSLYLAGLLGYTEIANLLIEKGADINAKTDVGTMINSLQQSNGGDTPLDAAVLKKKYEIADLLRKHGGKTAEELKAEGK